MKKALFIFVLVIEILIGLALAVNWYITNRLEDKIAAILIKNIEESSDGFYTLSYDKLSIGFYSGELSIQNLHFHPNPDTYKEWLEKDSLPKEVFDLKFNNIHFEGVNLKLIRSNRDLQFTLFDIDQPQIKITAPLSTKRHQKSEPTQIDDPYQIIKKHLKTISVKELNLKNAQVKYIVEDSIKPTIYSISDTDFSIYNFRLDENSYQTGKPLFSDNIVFSINKPQCILENDEFSLSIKGLNLSTKDSLITIKGVKLESTKDPKATQSRILNAELEEIAFHGFSLSRQYEARILTATKFAIDAPQINMSYYIPTEGKADKQAKNENDSVIRSASLYEIISPIFAKIQIDTIVINKAKFDYSIQQKGKKSNYSFNSLNFRADNFRIDSSHISRYNFIHSDNFHLDANQLNASIAEINYKVNIGALLFDTKQHLLSINNIDLQPIEEKGTTVSGKIGSIVSDNLQLENNSVTSKDLLISEPHIYVKRIKSNKSQSAVSSPKLELTLSIECIKLDNGIVKFQQDSDLYFANGVDMAIHNFSFDGGYSINDIIANVSNIGGKLSNPRSSFDISNLKYNSKKKTFDVSDLNYESTSVSFSAKEFNINNLLLGTNSSDSLKAEALTFASVRLNNNDLSFESPNITATNFSWVQNAASISKLVTQLPKFSYLSREIELKTELENLTFDNIIYTNDELSIGRNIFKQPDIQINLLKGEKTQRTPSKVSLAKLKLGEIFIDNANLEIQNISSFVEHLNGINIEAKDIEFAPNSQSLSFDQVLCSIPELSIPLDNNFYTLNSGKISLDIKKSEASLKIEDISLKSLYPKFEFAHNHPKNKDWFGLDVGSIEIQNIKMADLLEENIYAKNLFVNDTHLYNLKNQNIKIQHNIMPMIYEVIYKFPKKFKIENTNIQNFNVVYEELAKGKEEPGKIFFTGMNGKVKNLTNIADSISQYLDVYANGYLMGNGYFDALWQIPVSPQNDHFNLSAKLVDFNLQELNQLISPMAPASINSGYARSIDFDISATSLGAEIDMTFIYDKLNVSVWKQQGEKIRNKSLYSKAVNFLLQKENLGSEKEAPLSVSLNVDRDPYHSTFNYFWQILQPAVVESVGISEKRQRRFMKVGKVFKSVKNFFKPQSEEKKDE